MNDTNTPTPEAPERQPVYVASRASIPERGEMWRGFRDQGIPITSSWIDEDGEGQTGDFGGLWSRITNEIRAASSLVLYALQADFPLKGALIEAGIALGMGKPVFVCLPDLGLLPRNYRPIGSWIAHPLVTRCDDINIAMMTATRVRADVAGGGAASVPAWSVEHPENEREYWAKLGRPKTAAESPGERETGVGVAMIGNEEAK